MNSVTRIVLLVYLTADFYLNFHLKIKDILFIPRKHNRKDKCIFFWFKTFYCNLIWTFLPSLYPSNPSHIATLLFVKFMASFVISFCLLHTYIYIYAHTYTCLHTHTFLNMICSDGIMWPVCFQGLPCDIG